MTDRTKKSLFIMALLALLLLCYARILFTDKIIRAPDIIAEFYWGAQSMSEQPLSKILLFPLYASWDYFTNSGFTNEGGGASFNFLIPLKLIYWLFPFPSSIAWTIVLHLFFGASGAYLYCRLIGTSRMAALFAGLVFALATENASLINAGHVMKLATISYAPWAFFCLEKGFLSRRLFWFMTTAFVLAFQFFNTHWQIAYYTCLCVGLYGVLRTVAIIRCESATGTRSTLRLVGLNLVVLLFFLSTVAISLLPLANWSKDTNRGVNSGANTTSDGSQAKGGLSRDEAMSWSLPPEELGALIIPGFFGLSRQEGGPNPTNIASYYWGRMVFTQTASYFGLLPWLLIPLPLIYRRDKYTWLALLGVAGGILFSMGKFTPFYNLLYDYFPGINHFRVPKMIMFIPVFGMGVLSARGIDLLMDTELRTTKSFRNYLAGVVLLPILLLVFLVILRVGQDRWIALFIENLLQPTRYEQGEYLVAQRWNNLLLETGIAAGLASLLAVTMVAGLRIPALTRFLPPLLLLLYLADVGRVNDKFLFLTDAPVKAKAGEAPPLMAFLKNMPKTYRVLPADGSDPMQYIALGIPVMYTSNPVQQMRWQQFLDQFNTVSPMADIINIKYLVISNDEYQKQKQQLQQKFVPVFTAPGNGTIVLENRTVLPKAWLVPSAVVVTDPAQRLQILQDPRFMPGTIAVVESQPPLPLMEATRAQALAQTVTTRLYEQEHISVEAVTPVNALLVLGEKYYQGWQARVDGKSTPIVPVNHILRGVYLTPGKHTIEFKFDPLPFKIGKYLTLGSFALFAVMLLREWLYRRKQGAVQG